MADTAQIVYDHADGSTLNFFADNVAIIYQFEGKIVERKDNKDGVPIDLNRVWRVVTCDAKFTGDQINTFNGYIMPASTPAYAGTYPRIVVKLDGDTSLTIQCMVTHAKATSLGHNNWNLNITFTEID